MAYPRQVERIQRETRAPARGFCGLNSARTTDTPGDAAGRRELWRLVSVTPDEISSTVLIHGLRPGGEGWCSRSLARAVRPSCRDPPDAAHSRQA
ncbi:TIGR02679 domain-containing protein [Streptomyces anulatus]|uniref:TIGR02679 domain-containing protein n=1 Tax=Streptomyces anulatus TaxID=1892 RepID=UPI00340988FF